MKPDVIDLFCSCCEPSVIVCIWRTKLSSEMKRGGSMSFEWGKSKSTCRLFTFWWFGFHFKNRHYKKKKNRWLFYCLLFAKNGEKNNPSFYFCQSKSLTLLLSHQFNTVLLYLLRLLVLHQGATSKIQKSPGNSLNHHLWTNC